MNRRTDKLKNLKAVLLILSLGLIVYSYSLPNPFIWDDEILIVNNPYIRSWQNIPKMFSSPLVRFTRHKTFFYRPLQELSYTLDFHLWKLDPFGYHLSNVILHLINAVLIFFVLRFMTKNFTLSLSASLLFVIHPIHTQAVTYIAGRADLLAALFLLLAFLSHLKSFYLLSLLFFIPGLLSKEYLMIYPFLLILYEGGFRQKKLRFNLRITYFFSFIAVISAYLYLRAFILEFYDPKIVLASANNFSLRLFSIGKVVFTYLGLLFYPANLHMERALSLPGSFLELSYLLPWAGLLILFGLIFTAYKPRFNIPLVGGKDSKVRLKRLAGFFLAWFFVLLLPMLNILKLDTLIAEHWVYLASVGIFALLILVLQFLSRNKFLFWLILVLLLTFYSSFTIKRNIEWSDKLRFSRQTLAASPDSLRANYLVGQILLEKKLYNQAIAQFQKLISLKPNESDSYNILGVACIRSHKVEKAKAAFKQSLKLSPHYADPLNNLGLIYLSENNNELARRYFEKALIANPRHLGTMNNLGVYYKKTGKKELAVKTWQKVLSIDPSYKQAQNNLLKLGIQPANE